MKKILLLAALAMVGLQACEKNINEIGGSVSKSAKQALIAKYPSASNITWQSKRGYSVASFTNDPVRSTSTSRLNAWFDSVGGWHMTETDMHFDQLPEPVKSSFAASTYATWRVEEVDKIERNGTETVYVIEAEQANKEMDLYYSPDGVLTKEMADVDDDYDYGDYIPTAPNASIESYLKANYPNARILEVDREGTFTEVEILDGRTKRELIFDSSNGWIRTKTEIRAADLPTAITQALSGSAYSSYRIDDVDHYATPTAQYYLLELKSASGDVDVKITNDGVLTLVGNDSDDDDDDDHYTGSLNKTCVDFIAKNYPGSQIHEFEYERGYLEVEIRHENREKCVRFNASNVWVDTIWDIRQSELPQMVKSAIAASQYASYTIDDVEYVQVIPADHYRIELEKGNREVTMRIKADGVVI